VHEPQIREEALRLSAAGLNDCEVGRRLGIPRSTVRDWRRPRHFAHLLTCPRCGDRLRPLAFSDPDYAELPGCIWGTATSASSRGRRACGSRSTRAIRASSTTPRPCSAAASRTIGSGAWFDDGGVVVVHVYCGHLACVFPQHGPGKKHERRILLEDWQRTIVDAEPWSFLRGCIRSDGCVFVNRTGRYEYVSYGFANHSPRHPRSS
jgi:hypothetical protein